MTLFTLASFARDEHLTLRSGARTAVTYAVTPGAGGVGTRLAVRVAMAIPRIVAMPLMAGDLVMMRKQLLTLKAYAEREARAPQPPQL